jgi:hypothetical protein
MISAFAFDLAFYKKAFRTGPIKHPHMDIGTLIAASSEQVFVEAAANEGASGSGWFDNNQKLVLAPLSFTWSASNQYETPDATNTVGGMGSSGTSYRITKPLVQRMLDPATPANGVNGQYLVPSLGIIALGPVDAINLWLSYSPDDYPATENKGIMFKFLATSQYFNTTAGCSQNYIPAEPSLLDAPLDVIIDGTPPDPFPDLPANGDSDTVVVLEAIEQTLDKGNWVPMGSDAGLGTITGTIIGGGHWVGDVIRVRIRSFNVVAPADATKNWEGIYRVTLKAIDPFWDIAYGAPFATYAHLILVQETPSGQRNFYAPPNVPLPSSMRAHVTKHNGRRTVKTPAQRAFGGIRTPPPGLDLSSLPTVADYHLARMYERYPAMRAEAEKSAERRRYSSQTRGNKAQLFRHHTAATAHQQPHAAPVHRPQNPLKKRTQSQSHHLKGRRA